MIACPNCQASNPAGAQFCGSCGGQIAGGLAAQAGVNYAGFWIRFVAWIIDGLVLAIPNIIINVAVSSIAPQLLLQLIVSAGYAIGFWVGADGATPGKMAMGIKVTLVNGEPIDVGQAVLRYIGYYASGIILGIGYLMIAFTGEKRGLHDMIAGTIVVKTR